MNTLTAEKPINDWEVIDSLMAELSPSYWVKNVVGIDLEDWQQKALDVMHKYKSTILLASRQSGKTATTCEYIAWRAVHRAGYNLIFCQNEDIATENMDKIEDVLKAANVPIEKSTTEGIWLENGGKIIPRPGGDSSRGISTNKIIDDFKGYSGGVLMMDEASRINKKVFNAILPITANRNTQIVQCSTPAGTDGTFFNTWIHGINEGRVYARTPWILNESGQLIYDDDIFRDKHAHPDMIGGVSKRLSSKEYCESILVKVGENVYRQEYGLAFGIDNEPLFSRETLAIIAEL